MACKSGIFSVIIKKKNNKVNILKREVGGPWYLHPESKTLKMEGVTPEYLYPWAPNVQGGEGNKINCCPGI